MALDFSSGGVLVDAPDFSKFGTLVDEPVKAEKPDIPASDPMGTGFGETMAVAGPGTPSSVLENLPPDTRFDPVAANFLSNRANAEQSENKPRAKNPRAEPITGKTIPIDEQGTFGRAGSLVKSQLDSYSAGLGYKLGDAADAVGAKKVGKDLRSRAEALQDRSDTTNQSISLSADGAFEKYAPQILAVFPTMAVAAASGGLPVMFGVSEVQSYAEGRKAGLSPMMALGRAVPMGAAEVIGEKLGGTGKLLEALEKAAVKGGSLDSLKELSGRMLASGMREVPSEEATYAMQFGIDKAPGIGLKPDAGIDDFIEGAKDTAIVAAGAGGLMAGGGMAVNRLAARQRAFSDKYPTSPDTLPGVPPAPVDPVAEIAKAQSVDEAIAAATRATQSSTAVDNIGQILAQNQRPGLINSGQAATENVAPELENANVGTSPAIQPVPAITAGRGMPEPGVSLEAGLGTDGAAGPAVDTGSVLNPAAGDFVPLAAGTRLDAVDANNDQNPSPRASTKTQTAPAQTSEAGAPDATGQAAAGTPTGNTSVEAAGVAASTTFKLKPNGDGQYMVSARSNAGAPMGQMGLTVKEINGKKYLSIDDVMVRDEHQGKGVGTGLYSHAIDNLPDGIDGVLSESGWVKNDQQVPSIQKKLEKNYTATKIDGGIVFSPKSSIPQPAARQVAIQAEKERIEAKRTESKAARADASKAPAGLSVGTMPNSADPVTVKNGVVYVGKYPAANYDTGADVTVPDGASNEQIRDALKAAGALGGNLKVFGLSKAAPAQSIPAQAAPENIANSPNSPNSPNLVDAKQEPADAKQPPAAEAAPDFTKDLADGRAGLAELEKKRKLTRSSKRADIDGQIERLKATIAEMEASQAESAAPVVDATPDPVAQRAEAAKREIQRKAKAARLRGYTYAKSPFLAFLGKHGVALSRKADFSPDKNPMLSGYGPMFRNSGKNTDLLVQNAIEENFLPEGATSNDLEDLITQQISGKRIEAIYSPEVADRVMNERMAEAQAAYQEELAGQQEAAQNADFDPFAPLAELDYTQEDAEASGYSDAEQALQLEVNALLITAEKLGINTEEIKEQAYDDTREGTVQDYLEAARAALKSAIEGSNGDSSQDAGQQGDAGSQEGVSEFTHNGTRIYPVKIAGRDGAPSTDRWAVESNDNKARREAGDRNRGGDTLHTTIEDAKKAADFEAKQDQQEKARKERIEAESKAEQIAADAKREANKGKSLTEIKAQGYMAQLIKDGETGKELPRSEWVKRLIDGGAKTSVEMVNRIKPLSRAAFNRASNQEQSAHEKKIRDGGKVPEYSIGNFIVSKTEYDFAQSLTTEGLTAPTQQDVLDQQDRKDNAEALDQKEQIDREAAGQTLTSQTAPEQRKDTTTDIFGGPTVEDAQRLRDAERAKKATAPTGPDMFGEPAPQAKADGYGEAFTVDINSMFAGVPYRASMPVQVPDGYKVLSTEIIKAKTKIVKYDQEAYDLPATVYAWRVSAVQNEEGGIYSQVEAMTQDTGRTPQGEVIATFTKLSGNASDAINRLAPSIGKAALKAYEQATVNKGQGGMFARGTWRSALRDGIDGINAKALPGGMWKDGIKGLLNKGTVKADEVEWSGINEWLQLQDGKVTKAQVLEYLDGNGVKVEETVLGESAFEATFSEEGDDGLWRVYGERANEDDVFDTAIEAKAKSDAYNADIPRGPTKYGQYQLPGGENYKELLLTLPVTNGEMPAWKVTAPDGFETTFSTEASAKSQARISGGKVSQVGTVKAEKPTYKSSHWDQKNILAHIRFNERTDADGKRVLFLEEIQSDWAQEGKKKGFAQGGELKDISDAELTAIIDTLPTPTLEEIEGNANADMQASKPYIRELIKAAVTGQMEGYQNINQASILTDLLVMNDNWTEAAAEALSKKLQSRSTIPGVPTAPFVQRTDAWVALAIKRMISYAAENGFDKVAFVNGEQSAERYDLSKQISDIQYFKEDDGRYYIVVGGPKGGIHSGTHTADELENYIGKELAQRIVDRADGSMKELTGLDLKVGGEGMKAFYDKIVPTVAKDVLKRLGGSGMTTVNLALDLRTEGGRNVQVNRFREKMQTKYGDGILMKMTPEERATLKALEDGRTPQPGFDITPAMREKAAAGLPMFGRKPFDPDAFSRMFMPAQPMAMSEVQKAVDELTAKWKSGPALKVVARASDLPVNAPPDARGLIHNGVAYIVAGAHVNRDGIAKTLGHEAIGHYGLWEMLGDDGTKQFQRNLQLALKSGNVPLGKIRDKVRSLYVDEAGKFNLSPAEEANEIAAFAVEAAIDPKTGEFKPGMGFVKSVYAKIAEFLRSLGITVKFTNLELQGMLVSAMRGLEAGRRLEGGGRTLVAAAREPVQGFEPVKTVTGVDSFKTDSIALANGRPAIKQPGGGVKRIDYDIRDRQRYIQARREGATPDQAKEAAHVGQLTMDMDGDKFVSLRNIEIFQSKRGTGLAEKVIGGIMASLPNDAKLHIHDILPTATGFWDKMGAKFPRSEDTVVTANLTPEQFRSAYDSRARTARTQGSPGEPGTPFYARAAERGYGPDGRDVSGRPEGGQSAQAADKYRLAGNVVDGREVRDDVPNMSSIASSLDDYTILNGVREVPMSDFNFTGKSYSVSETKRIETLADRIKESGEINPLIVVIDGEGSYVLEGGHRGESLFRLGAKSFPAIVVLDNESLSQAGAPIAQTNTPAFKKWFGDSKVVDADGKPPVASSAVARLNQVLGRAGWEVEYIDLDLTGDKPKADIRINGADGRFLIAKVDTLGRASFETFQRERSLRMDASTKGRRPLSPMIDDTFLGRQKFEGARSMLRGMTNYLTDNATGQIALADMREAWAGVMAAPTQQIKSAIGNNGDFDGSNPNIAFARGIPTSAQVPIQPARQPLPANTAMSPWKDETGRMQFAPGQWLYNQLGRAAGPMLVRLGMKAASPELRRQLRQMKIEVEKAQEVSVAIARETSKMTEDERAMVSDLVEKELKAGVIPPAHAVKLAAMINDAMGRQTDELVSLGMLTKDSADKWRGQYLPRYYESKLKDKLAKTGSTWASALMGLTGRQSVMKGIKGKNLKGRGLYETIPEAELTNYEALGWEVRDPDYTPSLASVDGTVQVWRDFSPAEREKMGEIRDAGFRFVMGYMQTQRDIALGRMFEAMAQDPDQSSRLEKEGYVQVPTTTVSGTGAKVYGKLAGRWVPRETLSQLSNIEENTSEAWQMYRKALGVWKMGKTSMNPVSHVNNVVSNLTMAHFAGVGYHRGDKYIAAARDFVKKTPMLAEAKDNGLFLGTISDAELMNTMPEELRLLAQKQETTTLKVARTGFDIMTMFLRKPMGAAYQAEDTFFRYLIYKDARARGLEPQDAVDYAQRYIFTYDDLPKGARRIRDFGVPFFSYTYKAVPALLHTALTHPLRMAAPAAILWGINAAAYAIATGDDDDDFVEALEKYLTDPDFRAQAREKEKLEREYLPSWNKGTTALMTPKMIRLGQDEVTKLPLFIDVARIIPGGDMFDVTPNAGGIPLPQPITPSNPLFTTAVAMLGNLDLFRGKVLVDKNDTTGEASEKRLKWLWTQLTPAVAAGNYHWEKGMNALAQANGGEVKWIPDLMGGDATGIGRDGQPVQPKYAAMQTFGIKVRPMDIDTGRTIEKSMRDKMVRDIDTELKALQRLNSKGAIPNKTYGQAKELAKIKKDRLKAGQTVDGDDKD